MGVHTASEATDTLALARQASGSAPSNFLVGVAPPTMDLAHSIGEDGCGIGLDYYGYIYVSGRYFHVSNLHNWQHVAKPVRGSTARHKGKAGPMFQFYEGQVEITLTLDLKEGTLRFSSGGHSLGTIANVKGPLHAALTLTSSRQTATLAAGKRWDVCGRGLWRELAGRLASTLVGRHAAGIVFRKPSVL
jgi:hypothetical protein